MSTVDIKARVRRYYEEVVGTGAVHRVPEFISTDYSEVYNNVTYLVGIEGAKEHILGVRRIYPDLRVTVEQQIAEGEWVVSRVTARGTHEGVWLGMRPTRKVLEMTGVNVDRVVGGLIAEHGGAANLLEPFLGVGAICVADPVDSPGMDTP
jgi:predicted ester cyclase